MCVCVHMHVHKLCIYTALDCLFTHEEDCSGMLVREEQDRLLYAALYTITRKYLLIMCAHIMNIT